MNAHGSNIWLEVSIELPNLLHINEYLEMLTFHALPHPFMHVLHTCMILATDMISTHNNFSAWLKLISEMWSLGVVLFIARQSTTFAYM